MTKRRVIFPFQSVFLLVSPLIRYFSHNYNHAVLCTCCQTNRFLVNNLDCSEMADVIVLVGICESTRGTRREFRSNASGGICTSRVTSPEFSGIGEIHDRR
jgi:hypothetical protein